MCVCVRVMCVLRSVVIVCFFWKCLFIKNRNEARVSRGEFVNVFGCVVVCFEMI